MQIFLARNNVQAGPYTLDQLNIMLTSGEVQLDDLIWHLDNAVSQLNQPIRRFRPVICKIRVAISSTDISETSRLGIP